MKIKPFSKVLKLSIWTAFLSLSLLACFVFIKRDELTNDGGRSPAFFQSGLDRAELPDLIGPIRITSNLVKNGDYPVAKEDKNYFVKFTIDQSLQEKIEALYSRYSPAYAAFIAMDPETGKVLAMVDYTNEGNEGNLALHSGYPAASIFKIVTSAAALDQGKIKPKSVFPVNGSNSSLYKRNLKNTINRWTRYMSIEEAFAKSVNTVFGKIAMNRVGPELLQQYANSFGFNQKIPFDLPLEFGSAIIPTDDEFGLAESGSGYTKRQTLNPIQGSLIASSVVNRGFIPAPYIVDSVTDEDGKVVYETDGGRVLFHPIGEDTAKSLSVIMEHTVTRGTARREYRDYNHHPILSKLFIGAKTGSLTGNHPQGKYDWFVGFAQSSANPSKKLVFASMIINKKYWRVKSSYIAREAIIHHFKKLMEEQEI
ncbi:MAG: penicillin-binding transpeptidase domain-containing protein [Oligoflexia bacterium]|nr:penicillin-binding transpeptidase domain-containing protein [Oligoflexia bacterium]